MPKYNCVDCLHTRPLSQCANNQPELCVHFWDNKLGDLNYDLNCPGHSKRLVNQTETIQTIGSGRREDGINIPKDETVSGKKAYTDEAYVYTPEGNCKNCVSNKSTFSAAFPTKPLVAKCLKGEEIKLNEFYDNIGKGNGNVNSIKLSCFNPQFAAIKPMEFKHRIVTRFAPEDRVMFSLGKDGDLFHGIVEQVVCNRNGVFYDIKADHISYVFKAVKDKFVR